MLEVDGRSVLGGGVDGVGRGAGLWGVGCVESVGGDLQPGADGGSSAGDGATDGCEAQRLTAAHAREGGEQAAVVERIHRGVGQGRWEGRKARGHKRGRKRRRGRGRRGTAGPEGQGRAATEQRRRSRVVAVGCRWMLGGSGGATGKSDLASPSAAPPLTTPSPPSAPAIGAAHSGSHRQHPTKDTESRHGHPPRRPQHPQQRHLRPTPHEMAEGSVDSRYM